MFDRPQIHVLVRDEEFVKKMNDKKAAGLSFAAVTQISLGNKNANNFEVLITTMQLAFRNLGCSISVGNLLLNSHVNGFLEKSGAFHNELGKVFHQELMTMEKRYQRRWEKNIMADNCWSIRRDGYEEVHKCKCEKGKFWRLSIQKWPQFFCIQLFELQATLSLSQKKNP